MPMRSLQSISLRSDTGERIPMAIGNIIKTSFTDPDGERDPRFFEIVMLWGAESIMAKGGDLTDGITLTLRIFTPNMMNFISKLLSQRSFMTSEELDTLTKMGISPATFGVFNVSLKYLLTKSFDVLDLK